MNIDHCHILITGAAKRIGRMISETFLNYDVRLSAHYLSSEREMTELEENARKKHRKIRTFKADLRNVLEIKSAVREAIAHFGPVDILINSASQFHPTPTLDLTEKQWDDMLEVNLRGQFFFAQAVASDMIKKGRGVILNIADVYGEKPLRQFAPYTASKAALLMMTRNLAKEWAPSVRVNAISPGPVLFPEHYTDAQKQKSIDRTLLKRQGSPVDIANAVLFLVQNDYITGFNLRVDGGRSLV